MTLTTYGWALRQSGMGPTAKLVLLGLADGADSHGRRRFDERDLAKACEVEPGGLRAALVRLADHGFLIIEGPGLVKLIGATPDCLYCGGEAVVLDHVLARSRGGGAANNLVNACGFCNTSKAARDVREWAVATGRDWPAIESRLSAAGIRVSGREAS